MVMKTPGEIRDYVVGWVVRGMIAALHDGQDEPSGPVCAACLCEVPAGKMLCEAHAGLLTGAERDTLARHHRAAIACPSESNAVTYQRAALPIMRAVIIRPGVGCHSVEPNQKRIGRTCRSDTSPRQLR